MVFYLRYLCSHVNGEVVLALFLVCEVLQLKLSCQIFLACYEALVNQDLALQYYAITWYDVPLMKDQNVTWDQLLRSDLNRLDFLLIQQGLWSLGILMYLGIFSFGNSSNQLNIGITLLLNHLMFVRSAFICSNFLVIHGGDVNFFDLRLIIEVNSPDIVNLVDDNLALNLEIRLFGKFLLVMDNLSAGLPISVNHVAQQYDRKDIVLLINPQQNSVSLKNLIGSQHLFDKNCKPTLHRQLNDVRPVILAQLRSQVLTVRLENVPPQLVQVNTQLLVADGQKGLLLLKKQIRPLMVCKWNAIWTATNVELVPPLYHLTPPNNLLLLD